MPRTILGKVSLTPKGDYSPDTAYTALDVVSYGGSSWLALQDVTGVAPVEGENWMLLAQKGDQGASFTRMEKTAGTGAPGTIDTYTAYNSEGQAAGTVQVYNGMDGTGAGDFKADGTVPMTGNLQMAQHKITGVADATEDGDAVNKGQMDAGLAERADLTLSNLSNRQKALRNIGGRPNRNLLDNAHLAGGGSQQGGGQFPINQRGKTSYAAGASFVNGGIDRWRESNTNITINGDSINISSGTFSEEYSRFTQVTEKTLVSGKTYTISMLARINSIISNVVFRVCSSTYSGVGIQTNLSKTDGFSLISFTFVPNSNVENYGVEILASIKGQSKFDIDLKAIKLEEGPTQTLAYQDEEGNWQLFETPDYAEELAKCQRYLQVFGTDNYSNPGVGVCASDSVFSAFIPTPVTMRVLPTVTADDMEKITIQVPGRGNIQATSIGIVNSFAQNSINLDINASSLTQGSTGLLRITNGGKLYLSSEL